MEKLSKITRVLALLGLIGMACSGIADRPDKKPLAENKPAPTMTWFDFCQLSDSNHPSLFELQQDGIVVTEKIVSPGDITELRDLKLTEENVIGFRKDLMVDLDSVRFLLVPVGYSRNEIDQRFPYFVRVLRDVYKEIDRLEFGYLNANIPIGAKVLNLNQIVPADLKEISAAHKLISEVYPMKGYSADYIFVVNGLEKADGVWVPKFASGGQKTGAITIAHVVGHALNIGDEYNRYYEYLSSRDFGIDVFDSPDEELRSEQLESITITPPYGQVGTCNGKPVYVFYPQQDNIMRFSKMHTDADLLLALSREQSVLTPVQQAKIRWSIDLSIQLTQNPPDNPTLSP